MYSSGSLVTPTILKKKEFKKAKLCCVETFLDLSVSPILSFFLSFFVCFFRSIYCPAIDLSRQFLLDIYSSDYYIPSDANKAKSGGNRY